ncbi:MAG: hypothetical protein A2202_07860 [Bdellovibrionales bacterium RIFOXYA1_FULL_36_14]|nr:MAG: hypothetical protein A2202_07860 [Bdellovibrionales bacterium RIFOXYA1_FULL_36_14]
MKKENSWIKNHGFSLVEVMVAAGLLGVIALGGMRIVDFQTERTRDTSKNFQADNIMYDMMFALRDRDSCFETFKNKITTNSSIDKILRKDINGGLTELFKVNDKYGSIGTGGIGQVTIKEMKLGQVINKPVGSNLHFTNLFVTFEKKGGGSNKDTEATRLLPVKFIVDGTGVKLLRCVSENSNNLEDLCNALGGILDFSDNDLCKSINVKTFTAANSATMGGTIPARPYSLKAEGAVDVRGKMTFDYVGRAPGVGPVTFDGGQINNVTKIFVKGSASANEVSATKYNHVSDQKEKKNIKVLSEIEANRILSLRGVSFNWKDSGEKSLGLVAQEVQKYYPELVDQTGSGLTVQYANLIAPMLEVIKRQAKQIKENEFELQKIERKLASPKKKGDKK